MSKKTKAFIYQLLGFALLFIGLIFIIQRFSPLQGFWARLAAFVVGTILAPKFQAVKTNDGDKIFMRWIFIKGIKEVR